MADSEHEVMQVLVDGEPMTFAAFLDEHAYMGKEWRRDIEFDLGVYRKHEPHDAHVMFANYKYIKLVALIP